MPLGNREAISTSGDGPIVGSWQGRDPSWRDGHQRCGGPGLPEACARRQGRSPPTIEYGRANLSAALVLDLTDFKRDLSELTDRLGHAQDCL
jgi:peptide chain release factor 2